MTPVTVGRWLGGAVALALLAGVAMQWPAPGLLVLCTLIVTVALFLAPKPALAILAVFLVLQAPTVNVLGGTDTPLGLALQRLDEVIVAAGVVRLAVLLTWRPMQRRVGLWLAYAGAFAAVGVVSAVLAGVPVKVWVLGAFLALKFPTLVLLALSVDWSEEDAGRLARLGIALGPVLLGIALVILILPPEIQSVFVPPEAELEGFYARGGMQAMQAPFIHPGVFGWAMAVTGCYAAAGLLAGKVGRLATGSLAASVVGILGSLRRKPLAALPLAIAAGAMRHGGKRQRWAVIGVLVAMAALVALLARSRLQVLMADLIRTYLDPLAPSAARTLLYAAGYFVARDYFPLGAGFGRYGGFVSQLYYSPVYDRYGLSNVFGLSRDAPYFLQDTYWPHILGETGWIGMLILLAFFWHLWLRVGRAGKSLRDPWAVAFVVGASLALVEAMIESLAAPMFEASLQTYMVAVPLGISLGVIAAAKPAPEQPPALPAPDPAAPTAPP